MDTPPKTSCCRWEKVWWILPLGKNGRPCKKCTSEPCAEKSHRLALIDIKRIPWWKRILLRWKILLHDSPFPKKQHWHDQVCSFSETTSLEVEAFMRIGITLLCHTWNDLGTAHLASMCGSLSDFCGLMWDERNMPPCACPGTVLTTGGGWTKTNTDGVLQGIKLYCRTEAGLPNHWYAGARAFVYHPEYRPRLPSAVLYGRRRMQAKGILERNSTLMFLDSSLHLGCRLEMKAHALDMADHSTEWLQGST